MAETKIILNMVMCKKCRQVLLSLHRHDFRQCECENRTHCDGGTDYLKRGGASLNQIEELSIELRADGKLYKVTE